MSELPAPLTPADCDLRGLPFMPLDVVRLTDSDLFALATGDEFKAALTLWCKAWLQVPAASLPDDDRVLAHLTGTGPRWRKLKEMALHGWVKCSDGRLYHPVVAEKANEAWKHRQAQRERANKRWGNAGDRDGGTATAHATGHATARALAHATASTAAMQGTGTVKGQKKEETPLPPEPKLPPDVQAVMEAGGFVTPPPDLILLRKWREAGADFDQDVLAVVRTVSKSVRERTGKAPFKLQLFDQPIRAKIAEDNAAIEAMRRSRARLEAAAQESAQ
jgi:hypothetical protein